MYHVYIYSSLGTRCSRFYRYELIDRFFLLPSIANDGHFAGWTPRFRIGYTPKLGPFRDTGINGAYSIDLIRGELLYAPRPRRKLGVNLSVGIILVLEFEFAVIFLRWNTTADDISRHKLDACAFNNRADGTVARHGYNDNRGIRILLPLFPSFFGVIYRVI